MENLPVVYCGKDYLLLVQYASGYCEIIEDGNPSNHIELVHFSELKLKGNKIG